MAGAEREGRGKMGEGGQGWRAANLSVYSLPARNVVNPPYSSLETLPCFLKRIIRERKNKQESPRDGERIEEQ